MMDMLGHVMEDRRTAKGKTGGTLSHHTIEIWRTKLSHPVRIIGPKAPLSECDYDAVSRFLADRGRERKWKGATEPVSQHELWKELSALRFGLRLEKQRGAYPHDVDVVTRTRRFAVGSKPRKRYLSWEEIPKLLGALLQEDPQRVSAERLGEARYMRANGNTLASVAAWLDCSVSTVKRYLDMPDPGPVRGGLVRAQHTAWLIATAARDAEATRAELRDHDFDKWRVFIRGTKTAAAEAVIPIAPVFRPLLTFAVQGRPKTGPLFPAWANIGRSLALACKRAGIPRVSPNDLRRTHTSLLSQAGISNSELKHVTRHTTTRMLDIHYAQTNLDAVADALEKVTPRDNLLPHKKER